MSTAILVVEDEPNFERLILQRFRKKVRTNEYRFVFATNGFQALEKLKEEKEIEIILSDINMPQMDGLTFISKLNQAGNQAKVIMVSAYGDMNNIRRAMNGGAYDFVPKPIDFIDLENTIQKAIKDLSAAKLAKATRQQLAQLQQELAVANRIQQSILPHDFSIVTAGRPYQIYSEMLPAKQVGGDFYDFFLIDSSHLAVLVGDVSGKGMPAALFMAISRTLLKAFGLKGLSAGACLKEVNNLLIRDNTSDLFVTVFYGILDLENGTLEYCSGGHNPPYLVQADGVLRSMDDNQHIPLGVMEDYTFTSRTIDLEPGTSLFLYTDGVTEALGEQQEFFSEQRLEDGLEKYATSTPREMVENMVRDVKRFSGDLPQSDDITLMAIRRQA